MNDIQQVKARKKELEKKISDLLNDSLVEFDTFCKSKSIEFVGCYTTINKTYVDYCDDTQKCIGVDCTTDITIEVEL